MPAFYVADKGQGSNVLIEDGYYNAEIQSIVVAERDPNAPPSQFGNKPQYEITWLFTDLETDEGEPVTKRQWVNIPQKMTTNSKLYSLFSAILNHGNPLETDTAYELDDLLGKPCRVNWVSYINDKNEKKQRVESVHPLEQQQTTGVRKKAAAQIDPDDI